MKHRKIASEIMTKRINRQVRKSLKNYVSRETILGSGFVGVVPRETKNAVFGVF